MFVQIIDTPFLVHPEKRNFLPGMLFQNPNIDLTLGSMYRCQKRSFLSFECNPEETRTYLSSKAQTFARKHSEIVEIHLRNFLEAIWKNWKFFQVNLQLFRLRKFLEVKSFFYFLNFRTFLGLFLSNFYFWNSEISLCFLEMSEVNVTITEFFLAKCTSPFFFFLSKMALKLYISSQ